jgi:succinate dehydrogenase / fumarate reductase cytochrome b subunit
MPSTRVPDSDPPNLPGVAPLARRLFSLSGVVPLGGFLIVHLAVNARVLHSESAFEATVGAIRRLPALALLEWLFVFAPLLLHTGMGLWLVAARRTLAVPSPYPRAVGIAVRVTGVAAIAFLAMHLPELRLRTPGVRLDGGELATVLAADLSSVSHGVPWRGAAYLAGTACVTFHFAAGLWGFFATSRLGGRRAARKWASWAAAAIGAAMWTMLADVVVFHATGARLFGGMSEERDAPREACPSGP